MANFFFFYKFPLGFCILLFQTSIVDLTSLISSLIALIMVHSNRNAILSTSSQ